jgi:hypothetical protein
MTTEAERAANYKASQRARMKNDLARYKALNGSKTSCAALLVKTNPLRRDDGWEPVDHLTEDERDAIN